MGNASKLIIESTIAAGQRATGMHPNRASQMHLKCGKQLLRCVFIGFLGSRMKEMVNTQVRGRVVGRGNFKTSL